MIITVRWGAKRVHTQIELSTGGLRIYSVNRTVVSSQIIIMMDVHAETPRDLETRSVGGRDSTTVVDYYNNNI